MAFAMDLRASEAWQYGGEKKPERIALCSPRISEGSVQSCERAPLGNPQPQSWACSGMLCLPLTRLQHNSCTSPVPAHLETPEINDQKSLSIWEIKVVY